MDDYPDTTEKWWEMVRCNRLELRRLIAAYHPYYRAVSQKSGLDTAADSTRITATAAEQRCEVERKIIASQTVEDPLIAFDLYLESGRGDKLADLLSQTWFGAPESQDVHCAGFGTLCRLCSESGLVYDEEERPDEPPT